MICWFSATRVQKELRRSTAGRKAAMLPKFRSTAESSCVELRVPPSTTCSPMWMGLFSAPQWTVICSQIKCTQEFLISPFFLVWIFLFGRCSDSHIILLSGRSECLRHFHTLRTVEETDKPYSHPSSNPSHRYFNTLEEIVVKGTISR